MSLNVNDVDDRLSHAKNLLKKYKNKQGTTSSNNSLNANSNNNDYEIVQNCKHLNDTSSVGSTRPPSVTIGDHDSFDSSFFSENIDTLQLKKLLRDKNNALNETLSKLQELHSHYSELYSAYNEIINNPQTTKASEHAAQISQLQTALAVSIEEKTNLQSELRLKTSQLENLKSEHAAFEEGSKNFYALSAKVEQEFEQLRLECDRLSEIVASQSVQIETHRKESSSLEAKIQLIHQDRNEIQARLKYLYGEKLEKEKIIEQLKSDLDMKDIYIKQLTRFSQTDTTQDQLVIQTLSEEKNRFESQFLEKENEISDLKKQFESTRHHYDNCILEMSRQIAQLESDIQSHKTIKNDLESNNNYLEEQIRLLKASQDVQTAEQKNLTNNEVTFDETQISNEKFFELQNNFFTLQADFLRCRDRIQDLENIIEQKDNQIEEIQYQFIDAQRKIADFDESKRLNSSINSDVSKIVEQLQNEKATVSRAVEQNVELKKQLAELQNRLVEVINESAAKEDERLSALANIKMLQTQIEKLSLQNNISCENPDIKKNLHHLSSNADSNSAIGKEEKECHSEELVQSNKNLNIDSMDLSNDNQVDTIIKKTEVSDQIDTSICNDQNEKQSLIDDIENRLLKALNEKEQYRLGNEHLEHLLTALEAENESIGEYITLYHLQRAKVHQKLSKKDNALTQLKEENFDLNNQLLELQNAVLLLGNFVSRTSTPQLIINFNKLDNNQNDLKHSNEINKAIESTVNNLSTSSDENEELERSSIDLNQINNENLTSNKFVENSLNNDVKKNLNKTLERLFKIVDIQKKRDFTRKLALKERHAEDSTIGCSGCVECRGELFVL